MDGLDAEQGGTIELVRAVIARVLARYDWQLAVPPEKFFEAVIWETRLKHADAALVTPDQMERVVKRCYARVLYRASGANGTTEQARAFEELRRYLAACVRFMLHDAEAEADIAQQAVVNIMARHADCADMDAFLGWCKQVVVNLVRDRYRKQVHARKSGTEFTYVRREVSLDELTMDGQEADPPLTPSDAAAETERILNEALRGPMYEALLQALRDCLKQTHKVRVIVEIFLNDKKLPDLARELVERAGTIQAIKARALETLRNCDEMKLIFQDWGA